MKTIARFYDFVFQDEDDEFYGSHLTQDNAHHCIGADTSLGLVSATNTLTLVMPGDLVVLEQNVPSSYTSSENTPWVMTGLYQGD